MITFEEWWDKNWADVPDESADRTFGEEVWNAAQDAMNSDARETQWTSGPQPT